MGGIELLLIAVVGLLVIGPERLPETLRTLGLWLGRMRRSFNAVKTEVEKEIGMDEVRRQLHNEAVMEEMKRIEREVNDTIRAPSLEPHPDDFKQTAAATPATPAVNEPDEPAAPDAKPAPDEHQTADMLNDAPPTATEPPVSENRIGG